MLFVKVWRGFGLRFQTKSSGRNARLGQPKETLPLRSTGICLRLLTYIEWRNISILDITRQHTHLHHLHCAALHCNMHIYKYMYNHIIYVYCIICDIYVVYLYYIYIYYDVITPIYVYSIHNYLYYNTTYIRICFATQASKHLSRRRVKPCTTSS